MYRGLLFLGQSCILFMKCLTFFKNYSSEKSLRTIFLQNLRYLDICCSMWKRFIIYLNIKLFHTSRRFIRTFGSIYISLLIFSGRPDTKITYNNVELSSMEPNYQQYWILSKICHFKTIQSENNFAREIRLKYTNKKNLESLNTLFYQINPHKTFDGQIQG